MPLTPKQFPYTGPFSSTDTKFPSDSPAIEALKRMLVRAGFMDAPDGGMDKLDGIWRPGREFDTAFRKWQRVKEGPGDGVYGEQECKDARAQRVPKGKPNAGQYALDLYARSLNMKVWEDQNVPDEQDFRLALVKFCKLGFANEPRWHYLAIRPLDVTVEPNAAYIASDCSFSVKQAYRWASTESGLAVPDPTGYDWAPYGNTDSLAQNPRVDAPYRIGDVALYSGGSGHATMCWRQGTAWTSSWWSHGQEAGPMPTSLHYRSDLRFVVRPPLK